MLDNARIVKSISSPYAVPVVVNDAATLQPGQKVLIPVLTNDPGMIDQSTLQIVSPPATGTAVVKDAKSKSSRTVTVRPTGRSSSPVISTSGASLPTPDVKVIGPSVFLKLNSPENCGPAGGANKFYRFLIQDR